ncbi:MAG: phosphatase PAP2 family protein [Acidimicrobiia bacterium]|nr:phosphatase PAP2 family protein [Acidimicrobiia bacterium]
MSGRRFDLDGLAYPTRRLVVILFGALAVFIALTAFVAASPHDVPALDQSIFEWAVRNQHQWLNSTLRALARLGATEVVLPVGLVVSGLVAIRRRSLSPIGITFASYGLAAFTTLRVKHLLDRPEPFDVPGEQGLSFPSGHLSQSVSVYLVLFVLVEVFRHRSAIRIAFATALGIVVVAIIYRSAHFVTDIFGGAALGATSAAAAILVMRGLERMPGTRDLLGLLRSRPVTQPVELSEHDGGDAGRERDRSRA